MTFSKSYLGLCAKLRKYSVSLKNWISTMVVFFTSNETDGFIATKKVYKAWRFISWCFEAYLVTVSILFHHTTPWYSPVIFLIFYFFRLYVILNIVKFTCVLIYTSLLISYVFCCHTYTIIYMYIYTTFILLLLF